MSTKKSRGVEGFEPFSSSLASHMTASTSPLVLSGSGMLLDLWMNLPVSLQYRYGPSPRTVVRLINVGAGK